MLAKLIYLLGFLFLDVAVDVVLCKAGANAHHAQTQQRLEAQGRMREEKWMRWRRKVKEARAREFPHVNTMMRHHRLATTHTHLHTSIVERATGFGAAAEYHAAAVLLLCGCVVVVSLHASPS